MVDIILRSSRSAPLSSDMVDENFSNLKTAIEGIPGGGSSPFTDLSDTPSDYIGHGNKLIIVKAAEDGLEFAAAGSPSDHGGLTGLGDDDHTQYHTDARGDARYENKVWTYYALPSFSEILATSNTNYAFDNTTASAGLRLPAAPSDGDIIRVTDPTGTWATNNLTIARNGNNIAGLSEDLVCDINYAAFGLVYRAATTNWYFI